MRQDTVKDVLRCLTWQRKPLELSCGGCTNDSLCYAIRQAIKKYRANVVSQGTIAAMTKASYG